MSTFAFALPMLFIFHDLEEIIGMRLFLDRNEDMLQCRFPKIIKLFHGTTNEGFALAVAEEFVVFTIIALLALWIDNHFVWNVWLGAFIGLTFHFVVHFGQAIVIRKYIPALATSIISLPISIYILKQCLMMLTVDIWQMIFGIVIVAVNLVCAHKMTKWRL